MFILKNESIFINKGYQLSWLERTPDKGEGPGSNPGWPTGGIAQLVERCLCKANVSSSNLLISIFPTCWDLILKLRIIYFKVKEIRAYGGYLGIQRR